MSFPAYLGVSDHIILRRFRGKKKIIFGIFHVIDVVKINVNVIKPGRNDVAVLSIVLQLCTHIYGSPETYTPTAN